MLRNHSAIRAAVIGLATLSLTLVTACGTSTGGPGGGYSGGGGNAITAAATDIAHVKDVAIHSRFLILSWLNYEERSYQDGYRQGPHWDKLFKNADRTFELFAKLKIEFRETAPCIDPLNREFRDGSADGSKPDEICISGANLAKKASRDDAEYVTEALIVHEVSHLLGTNESEAVRLQLNAQEDLKRYNRKDWIMRFGESGQRFLFLFLKFTSETGDRVFCADVKMSAQYAGELSDLVSRYTDVSPYRRSLQDTVDQLGVRTRAVMNYACGTDPSEPEADRATNLAIYLRGFHSGETVSVQNYEGWENGDDTDVGAGSQMISKITTPDQLRHELETLEAAYEDVRQTVVKEMETEFPLK